MRNYVVVQKGKFSLLADFCMRAKELSEWQKFVQKKMRERDVHLGDVMKEIADEWAKEEKDSDQDYTDFVKDKLKEKGVDVGNIMKEIADEWKKK